MDLFEEEWKVIASLKFNEKVPIPSHLLLSMADLSSMNISYTQKPVMDDMQNLRYNIHIFFLLRKIRYLLCQEDIPQDYNFDEYPLSYMKPQNEWQTGLTYDVDANACTRCNLKIGSIHSVCYMVENEDYFLLAEPD
mmetsp:Transcript_23065/g.3797  ORF Transcript_23065/g.3797 Transcript_23065/m.3797 type:complete len:137 (+) Transcript_23065:389-799(+)